MKRRILAIALAMLALLTFALQDAPRVSAAASGLIFTVNQTADLTDALLLDNRCDTSLLQSGDQCSLRAAIQQANHTAGTDTIRFVSTAPHTLTRNGTDDDATRGDLDITSSLTLQPIPSGTTIINGNSAFTDRIFHILNGATVTMNRISVQGGNVTGDGGGISIDKGLLIMNNGSVISNRASHDGGGIAANPFVGGIQLSNTVIANNTAGNNGGGISGSATLLRSSVQNNVAIKSGGGIEALFGLSLTESAVLNNQGIRGGGGIQIPTDEGNFVLTNSTLSGNFTNGDGGGISISGANELPGMQVTILHSTLSNNIADLNNDGNNGGGIFFGGGSFAVVGVTNSIIAGNFDGNPNANSPDCAGTIAAASSLIGNTASCTVPTATNLLNVNAKLGALALNGGPTKTHGLLAGSPAIDTGNPAACNALSTDQRGTGFPRSTDGDGVNGARCDMGAFEVGAVGIGSVSPNRGSSPAGALVIFDLTWDSPTRWRDVHTLELRFLRQKEKVLRFRFTEGLPNSTFSLLDQAGNVIDSGNAGDAGLLKNGFGSLDLAQSGFTSTGPDDPHVVIHFAVKFKKSAAGKLKIQKLASDDFGNVQAPEPAGTFHVKE